MKMTYNAFLTSKLKFVDITEIKKPQTPFPKNVF